MDKFDFNKVQGSLLVSIYDVQQIEKSMEANKVVL